jgi:hypothetical protein
VIDVNVELDESGEESGEEDRMIGGEGEDQ